VRYRFSNGFEGPTETELRRVSGGDPADAGRSVTDGEMRRECWHMDFIYQLGGVTRQQSELEIAFTGATHTPSDARITRRITLEHTIHWDGPSNLRWSGGARAIRPD
jgi:hypothetical protein